MCSSLYSQTAGLIPPQKKNYALLDSHSVEITGGLSGNYSYQSPAMESLESVNILNL